jgi:RNA polymerase sigma-70 factor (ECF subfamily)
MNLHENSSSSARATSTSLLDQVKVGDGAGWQRLTALYRPLVLWWCRQRVSRYEDAEDLTQEVFATVLTRIGDFDRQHRGSFRAWLKTITQFKLLEYWKQRQHHPAAAGGSDARQALEQTPDPHAASSLADDEVSERRILLQSALELIRPEFEPRTWQAAMRVLEGQPAATVAADLGITRNAVFIAKSRVLARLRKEQAELFE